MELTGEQEFIIEIATADFESTRKAVLGKADRIELCADLGQGGTTPSFGTIKQCREHFSTALFPIIRPRGGDFLYSPEEFSIIKKEVLLCRELGCDGIVTGLLSRDGSVDRKRMDIIMNLAYPMEVTFHRAFDRSRDPFEAMETLIEIGCQRILTSGQKTTAPEGLELIARLVQAANGRIVIMPGSGVRKENILELARKTGASEFHSSLRTRAASQMDFVHPSFAGSEESYSHPVVDQEAVIELRKALNS